MSVEEMVHGLQLQNQQLIEQVAVLGQQLKEVKEAVQLKVEIEAARAELSAVKSQLAATAEVAQDQREAPCDQLHTEEERGAVKRKLEIGESKLAAIQQKKNKMQHEASNVQDNENRGDNIERVTEVEEEEAGTHEEVAKDIKEASRANEEDTRAGEEDTRAGEEANKAGEKASAEGNIRSVERELNKLKQNPAMHDIFDLYSMPKPGRHLDYARCLLYTRQSIVYKNKFWQAVEAYLIELETWLKINRVTDEDKKVFLFKGLVELDLRDYLRRDFSLDVDIDFVNQELQYYRDCYKKYNDQNN